MTDQAHMPPGPAAILREFRRIVDSTTSPVINRRRREAFLRRPEPAIRVEAVELAPAIHDEEGTEVSGSTTPRAIPHRHPMVKVDPPTNRIAQREVRIRVRSDGRPDGHHAGKRVSWSMEPLFVRPGDEGDPAGEPEFRGDWQQAAEDHRDRFEASADFASEGFTRLDQERATTTVDATGHTAIRINLPPIAFNAARISAQLEGEDGAVELLDLEVPGIIVIDPGHGGQNNVEGSNANHAVSHTSRILEKDLALEFSFRSKAALEELRDAGPLNLRVYLTRLTDENRTAESRAAIARDKGADALLSIHFNGFDGRVRGTETVVRRRSDNWNYDHDVALAERVNSAVYRTILGHDKGAQNRGVKEQQLAVLSERFLGNTADWHPVRSALLEVEFIDNQSVDQLLSINEGHEQVRQDIADAIANALIEDLKNSP